MSDYSYTELMQMQNDAIKRVEDMQRRARQSAGLEKEAHLPATEIKKDEPRRIPMPNDYLEHLKIFAESSNKKESTKIEESEKKSIEENKSHLPSGFNMDGDSALLLSLIMLLAEEKADETLIMALLYMLT